MTVVYSAGYQRLSIDRFVAFVQREGLTVVDVRLKPYSRQVQWNQKALAGRLFGRYVHIEALGNLNYKGGPIALKDEALGLAQLRDVLGAGPAVVLCVCADPAICHRTVVLQRLGRGYHIRMLTEETLALVHA